nr:MAG TPA: hypothetical protein [Caudoviricetes sp.]
MQRRQIIAVRTGCSVVQCRAAAAVVCKVVKISI